MNLGWALRMSVTAQAWGNSQNNMSEENDLGARENKVVAGGSDA